MATYTVKPGDTKSKLKSLYGIDFNSSQYRSTDPNKLFAGEVITLPNQNSTAPVVKNNQIDLSKVVEGKKPIGNAVSVVSYQDNPDGTTTNTLSDGSKSVVKYSTTSSGSLKPVEVPVYEDMSPEGQLERSASALEQEIAAIEARMANKETTRTNLLDDNGIFEDMQQLDELKAQLLEAQDRAIEIPIEKRRELRGQQATKTEFNAATRPELERNALDELAKSRATSRLTDSINTNIAIIDQKLKAEFERDSLLYTSKIGRLEKIEKLHADIITSKQAALLESQKFQQQLVLESIKSDNSLRNDLLKEIATRGVGGVALENYTTASIDDLLKTLNQKTSVTNWTDLSFEEASMTLSKDEFEKYKYFKETNDTRIASGVAAQQGANFIIDTIESMLNDTEGMKTSVGSIGWGNMDFNIFGLGTESTQFRAKFKTLLSANTLETLKNLKSTGATLGAVSEAELRILEAAQQSLSPIIDENGKLTGRSNLTEAQFEEALETMRTASMKVYIASGIGKAAYAQSGLQNADYETTLKMYEDLKENGSPDLQLNPGAGNRDYAAEELLGAATDVIRKEEGFMSQAYQDTTGTWTIGFGTTTINGRPVQPTDALSREQAEYVMQEQIVNNYTNFADRISTNLTPNQFAALTSFEYNLGPGVWNSTTGKQILTAINSGRYQEAGNLMLAYNKSRDPNTGTLAYNSVLANRRKREASLLLS